MPLIEKISPLHLIDLQQAGLKLTKIKINRDTPHQNCHPQMLKGHSKARLGLFFVLYIHLIWTKIHLFELHFFNFFSSCHVYFFVNSVARIWSSRQSGGLLTQLPPVKLLASWRYLEKLAKIWPFSLKLWQHCS